MARKIVTTRKARVVLTAAQKAAATKRRNGLDLCKVARKALKTRQANAAAIKPVRKVGKIAKTSRRAKAA